MTENSKVAFNNCSDIQKNIIREYNSWKKSDCNINLKFTELTRIRKMAIKYNIEHLI